MVNYSNSVVNYSLSSRTPETLAIIELSLPLSYKSVCISYKLAGISYNFA